VFCNQQPRLCSEGIVSVAPPCVDSSEVSPALWAAWRIADLPGVVTEVHVSAARDQQLLMGSLNIRVSLAGGVQALGPAATALEGANFTFALLGRDVTVGVKGGWAREL